jgi:hypothetical protein
MSLRISNPIISRSQSHIKVLSCLHHLLFRFEVLKKLRRALFNESIIAVENANEKVFEFSLLVSGATATSGTGTPHSRGF